MLRPLCVFHINCTRSSKKKLSLSTYTPERKVPTNYTRFRRPLVYLVDDKPNHPTSVFDRGGQSVTTDNPCGDKFAPDRQSKMASSRASLDKSLSKITNPISRVSIIAYTTSRSVLSRVKIQIVRD
jgi:hypothetical protein